jgi:hypothetical protein
MLEQNSTMVYSERAVKNQINLQQGSKWLLKMADSKQGKYHSKYAYKLG